MNAQALLHDLAARGVILSSNGDQLDIDAPSDVLTDELLATLREHKAELLALLRSEPTERRPIGTLARPRVVRGTRALIDCPWSTCGGPLTAHGRNLYVCATCATWFEMLPPEDLGDLDNHVATEWIM